jgi:flavin reductase (DIM6/NTAB) family NADH-FMN oxidoreductase RutF
MLGLGAKSQTAQNLLREKECVLNLPSVSTVDAVNRLARLTGTNPVPPHKEAMGYRYEKNKFEIAKLTARASELVDAPCIVECPVQLEAVLETSRPFGNRPDKPPTAVAFEVRIVRAHGRIYSQGRDPKPHRSGQMAAAHHELLPFLRFECLSGKVWNSTLAEIPEQMYRPVEHMAR